MWRSRPAHIMASAINRANSRRNLDARRPHLTIARHLFLRQHSAQPAALARRACRVIILAYSFARASCDNAGVCASGFTTDEARLLSVNNVRLLRLCARESRALR